MSLFCLSVSCLSLFSLFLFLPVCFLPFFFLIVSFFSVCFLSVSFLSVSYLFVSFSALSFLPVCQSFYLPHSFYYWDFTCCTIVQLLKWYFLSDQPFLDHEEVFEGQLINRLLGHAQQAVHLRPMLDDFGMEKDTLVCKPMFITFLMRGSLLRIVYICLVRHWQYHLFLTISLPFYFTMPKNTTFCYFNFLLYS